MGLNAFGGAGNDRVIVAAKSLDASATRFFSLQAVEDKFKAKNRRSNILVGRHKYSILFLPDTLPITERLIWFKLFHTSSATFALAHSTVS